MSPVRVCGHYFSGIRAFFFFLVPLFQTPYLIIALLTLAPFLFLCKRPLLKASRLIWEKCFFSLKTLNLGIAFTKVTLKIHKMNFSCYYLVNKIFHSSNTMRSVTRIFLLRFYKTLKDFFKYSIFIVLVIRDLLYLNCFFQ